MLALTTMLAVLVVAGCSRTSPISDGPEPPSDSGRILRQMLEAYQHAKTYADRGVVRLRYRVDGQWVEDEGKLAVRFERPNRLLVRAYQLTLACDGGRWQSIIADPQTRDLDGQVVVRPAPQQLKLDVVYEDSLVLDVIAGGMGGPPVSLELLLSEKPLDHLFGDDVRRELLDDDSIGGHPCHRLRVTLQEGPLVFWIDRESFVLRRLEYPTTQLAAQLDPSGQLEDLTLVADFRDAGLNVDLSGDEFTFHVPAEAKIVSRFVLPPQPLPSDLYGRLPGDFQFVDLQSHPVTHDSLLGKTTVLAWFNIHPASEMCLKQLAEVRRSLPEDAPVVFLAVCTEPTSVGNRQLQQLVETWQLNIPIVRDLEAYGRDTFEIPGAPTVVVIDARGIVQAFEVGANPTLVETLPLALNEVTAGQDLAGKIVAQFRQQNEKYQQALSQVLQPSLQGAAPRSRPVR